MQLMIFGHLIGIVFFLGCGLAAAVVNRLALKSAEGRSLDDANGSLSRLAGLGAGLIFLSGIGAIFTAAMSPGALLKQPWLSAMITLALVAAALIGIAGARARRLASAPPDATTARAARLTIWKLQLGFLVAGFGAIVCGIWRF